MECKYIGVLCQYLPYIPLHIPPIVSTYERSHKHKPQTLCLCGNRKIYTAMANSMWKSRKCYIVTYMLHGKCYIVTVLCYVLIKLSELDIYYLSIQTMAPLVSNTKQCFKFMSFLDGIAYSADNDTVDFSVERLGLITTDDVVHYLHFKAYGTQHPAEDDFNNPPLCCFVTLLYHKKAISYFLRLAGNSNATSALEVNFKIIRYPSLCSSLSSQQ